MPKHTTTRIDFQQPPSSNTGAQNTSLGEPNAEKPRRALVDAVCATYPVHVADPADLTELHSLLDRVGFSDERVPLDHAGLGYHYALKVDDARVYYGGGNATVHVQMMGQACRIYEARHGAEAWANHWRRTKGNGGWYKRSDLAIDDRTGAISVGLMLDEARAGRTRTRSRKGRHVQEFQLADDAQGANNAGGGTLYIGSRQSSVMVRAYDKAEERRSKGELVTGPWLRVELELKDNRAEDAMQFLALGVNLGELAASMLRSVLNFVEPTADTNRSRWPVAAWWDAWLGQVEALRWTPVEKAAACLERAKTHLARQWAPTVAAIRDAVGMPGLVAFVRDLVTGGERRMGARHHEMVRDFQRLTQDLSIARAQHGPMAGYA